MKKILDEKFPTKSSEDEPSTGETLNTGDTWSPVEETWSDESSTSHISATDTATSSTSTSSSSDSEPQPTTPDYQPNLPVCCDKDVMRTMKRQSRQQNKVETDLRNMAAVEAPVSVMLKIAKRQRFKNQLCRTCKHFHINSEYCVHCTECHGIGFINAIPCEACKDHKKEKPNITDLRKMILDLHKVKSNPMYFHEWAYPTKAIDFFTEKYFPKNLVNVIAAYAACPCHCKASIDFVEEKKQNKKRKQKNQEEKPVEKKAKIAAPECAVKPQEDEKKQALPVIKPMWLGLNQILAAQQQPKNQEQKHFQKSVSDAVAKKELDEYAQAVANSLKSFKSEMKMDSGDDADDDAAPPLPRSVPVPVPVWHCSTCTYRNIMADKFCVICTTPQE